MADNKKNVIPLVLAVVLALAAVFAVNRLLTQKNAVSQENMIDVVVAGRNLVADELIASGSIYKKSIPRSAAPSKVVPWQQRSMIINLKMQRAVSKGDYISFDTIGADRGLSDMLGEGEWAIPITLSGGAITSRLRPGDEIALIGTYTLTEVKKATLAGQKSEESSRKVTLVVLPRVRILALNANVQQGGDQFVLALPPAQAQILFAAQEHGVSLSPALRKPHDNTNMNRTTAGLVDKETFNNLALGVERTLLPVVPIKK